MAGHRAGQSARPNAGQSATPDDIALIQSGLDHDAGRVRSVALGAAARAGVLDTETIVRFLADEEPDVRRRAVELAARVDGGIEVAPILIDLLDDPEVAEVAAFALGELDLADPVRSRAVAAIGAQATDHDDPLCRESAVAALGAIGDGLDHILAATGDVATVRRRAVLALAPFEGPAVDAALERALSDRDWQVRQAAEDLLAPPDDPRHR